MFDRLFASLGLASLLGLVLGLAPSLRAEDLAVDAGELPRIPPVAVAEALTTLDVRPGFRVELVAHEPQVVDPVAACFDEDGALFVVEMRGYSERREEKLGRVKRLRDLDGDGAFEEATVYADGLQWPTGMLCYDGGIFVTASPDILYLRDSDGDGVAEERKVVLTGFGAGASRLNMQALLNSLRWGPDNRVWGATSNNGGALRRPDQPESEAVSVRGSDFSFDPKTFEFRTENQSAQFGMSFDAAGRRYSSSNSHHLQAVMWERDQAVANPYFPLPAARVDIPVDGPAAEVFRLSPDEPWRIVRTRWRIGGLVKGPVEGGGRVSGYFTGATGATIFTGDAWGEAYVGDAFIGDAGSNLVHRKVIGHPGGVVQPVARRGVGEERREFLASTSNWFRPVNFLNAPDGCLHVLDMHREVIEHPWSIPEEIKRHLDLNSGWDRGRIFRIVPDNPGFERRPPPRLGEASDEQLVELLDHPNGWHRTTARRLLWERGAWRDEMANRGPKGDDVGSRARFDHLLSLGSSEAPDKMERLLAFLPEATRDPWMAAGLLYGLRTPAEVVAAFEASCAIEGAAALANELAEAVGRVGDAEDLRTVITRAADAAVVERLAMLVALADGAEGADGNARRLVAAEIEPFLPEATAVALSANAATTDRRVAARLLGHADDDESLTQLRVLLGDPGLAAIAIAGLATRNDPEFPFTLINAWPELPTAARELAVGRLAAKPEWAKHFLDAVVTEVIDQADVSAAQQKAYRGHRDAEVSRLAIEVFPPPGADRAAVLASYQEAMTMKGNAARGAAKFAQVCIACHRSGEDGVALGPDRVTFQAAGPESLLKSILDPNAEVAPQFVAYTVTLATGEVLVGLIASEDRENVTLRLPGGLERRLKRSEVRGMSGLGTSLMPEGLEAQITVEEMADLLEYLTSEG